MSTSKPFPKGVETSPGVMSWSLDVEYLADFREPLTAAQKARGLTLGTLKRQPMRATVLVQVNVQKIASTLGPRAARSRGKRSVAGHGQIRVDAHDIRNNGPAQSSPAAELDNPART